MRKSRITFGPGAASLILIVVILSMSVLGILALMNARMDGKLTKRSTQVVQAMYQLNDKAERSLAELDATAYRCQKASDSDEAYLIALGANLPKGMLLVDRTITWQESDGYRTLDCAVKVAELGAEPRMSWVNHRTTAITEETWN